MPSVEGPRMDIVMYLKQTVRDLHRHRCFWPLTGSCKLSRKYLKFCSDGISFLSSNTNAATVAPHCGEQ